MIEMAWICPRCGQWGTGRQFSDHRLPEAPITDTRICKTASVEVMIGPFVRHLRERAMAEVK